MKRILIMLFCICILSVSAKCQFNTSGDGNDPGAVGGDPDQEDATQVPFDDYVPFMVAGIVVYGIYVNRQKRGLYRVSKRLSSVCKMG